MLQVRQPSVPGWYHIQPAVSLLGSDCWMDHCPPAIRLGVLSLFRRSTHTHTHMAHAQAIAQHEMGADSTRCLPALFENPWPASSELAQRNLELNCVWKWYSSQSDSLPHFVSVIQLRVCRIHWVLPALWPVPTQQVLDGGGFSTWPVPCQSVRRRFATICNISSIIAVQFPPVFCTCLYEWNSLCICFAGESTSECIKRPFCQARCQTFSCK